MHTFFVNELNQLIVDCCMCQKRNLVLVILYVCGIVCISGVIVIIAIGIIIAFIATTTNVGICGTRLKELVLKELVRGAKELVVE